MTRALLVDVEDGPGRELGDLPLPTVLITGRELVHSLDDRVGVVVVGGTDPVRALTQVQTVHRALEHAHVVVLVSGGTVREVRRLVGLAADVPSDLELLRTDAADLEDRVAALCDGSPGRGVELAGQGVEVSALVADLLAAPAVTVTRAHEVADRLLRQDGFTPFMVLLRDGIARAVRGAVKGSADPAQRKLVSQRPLAAWGELWHALGRIQQDTERSHLDKRHAIVSALTRLKAP